jgi:hypothetical protein
MKKFKTILFLFVFPFLIGHIAARIIINTSILLGLVIFILALVINMFIYQKTKDK